MNNHSETEYAFWVKTGPDSLGLCCVSRCATEEERQQLVEVICGAFCYSESEMYVTEWKG